MFWRRGERDTPRERATEDASEGHGPIRIERDAERPNTILRVATELERRGAEIVELFKEVESGQTRAILPIYLRWKEQDFFVEVETRRWDESGVEKALNTAAALRGSDYAGSGLGLLSAYPAPEKVVFFFEKSPAALFQLDLHDKRSEDPDRFAGAFVEAVRRRWDTDLAYDLDSLRKAEDLVLNSLREPSHTGQAEGSPPVLDATVEGLGYYLGEIIRRHTGLTGVWVPAQDWGEALLLEVDDFNLDPVGKARAFLANGARDSVAYYAEYVSEELRSFVPSSAPGAQDQA